MKKYLVSLLFVVFACQIHAASVSCANTLSDPDGDGWGWENEQSCQVGNSQADQCPDLDGDGWGWINGQSCQVASVQADQCPDPDGDGWGWINGQSCEAASSVSNDGNSVSTTLVDCVDYDGDGWGWANGQSCLVTTGLQGFVAPLNESKTASSVFDFSDCSVLLSTGQSIATALQTSNNVCLSAGRYTVNQMLSFKSGQSLIGVDANDPPVVQISASRGLTTTRASRVRFENVIIDGNSTGAQEFAILVGTGSANVVVKDVVVRNTMGIGIGITGSNNVRLLNTSVQNIGLDSRLRQAVWVTTASQDIVLDGVSVVGRPDDVAGGDHAITCIDGVRGFTVRNSRSQFAGSGAIAINNCSSINIAGNTLIDGREHGVDIVNGSVNALVENNTINGFDRSAMVFDDHSWQCAGCGANPTGIRVVGNSMSNNNRVGLARCQGIAVDRNLLVNPDASQKPNHDWIEVTSDNTFESGSSLYCEHIH